MKALNTSGTKLTSLKVDSLDWRVFETEPKTLHQITLDLDQLRHFQLSLTANFWWECERCQPVELQTFLKTGALKRFIEPFIHLRSLLIDLPIFASDSTDSINGHLSDIIPRGHRWANLTKLSLRNFECDDEEFQELLLSHKDTLRELCLGTVFLRSGTWETVIAMIHKELRLKTACFCGKFWQLNPDGSPELAFFHFGETYLNDGRRWERRYARGLVFLDQFICRPAELNQDANHAEDRPNESEQQVLGDNAQGEQQV